MMLIHELIEPLSSLWWKGIIICFVVISLLILLLRNKSIEFKEKTSTYFAYLAIIFYVSTNIFALIIGNWTIQDFLPLHLCNISYFICILVLLNKKQWMYEWTLLLAMPSALNALITPELIWGSTNWYIFEYYFMHGSLILVPLYLMFVMNYKLRIFSWWKTFLRAQIVFVIVFLLNLILDTNYMFLLSKPLVNNPLIIGDWPFYILFVQLIGLLHIVIIYKLSPKLIK
jgi:hypothetical integral membrane protein (TIGR02206 family)|tara:strand:- start:1178 stop:1864 length:687 start_codon:yes stop_codon:yes gene_type:complete